MNRRAFLKLFVGTVAIVAIPIPHFLLPKEVETPESHGGSLTMEMIEDASRRAMENYGKPDVMYMSKVNYKRYSKLFGYKVEYRGDKIVHRRIKPTSKRRKLRKG